MGCQASTLPSKPKSLRMIFQRQKYDVQIEYKPSKYLGVADLLLGHLTNMQ